MKVPYDANKEIKGQTVAQDLKITTFRKLMSLYTAYDLNNNHLMLHLGDQIPF